MPELGPLGTEVVGQTPEGRPQPIAPEDDLSRSYGERREQATQDDVIERARRKSQAPADIEVGPVGEPERGAEVDPSEFRKGAADVGRGVFVESPMAVATGVVDAATEFTENIMQLTDPLAQFLESEIPLGEAPSPEALFGTVRPADPESATGRAIQGVAQFVTGFIPALRATRALNLSAKAGGAGSAAEGALAGSLADVAVIDEAEQRLSGLIQEVPELQNPVTEFLATDPDDTTAEAKFKQAVEGLGIGLGADALLQGLRFISKARRSREPTGAADIAQAKAEPQVASTEQDFIRLGDSSAPVFKIDDNLRTQADRFLRGEPLTPGDARLETIGNINMARIGGPEDVKQVIAQTAKLFEDRITTTAQTNEQTIALANEIAADPQRMLETLTRGEGAFTASEVTALRFLVQQSGTELQGLARQAASVNASDVDRFLFERHLAFHGALLEQTSRGAREAGRALQAFQITAEGAKEQERAIRELLKQSDIDSAGKAAMLASLETPEGMNTFVRQSLRARTSDALLEAWINGLLSGPQTHAVNMLSNAMVATWQIPERMLARGIRVLTGGDGVMQGEATAQAFGLLRGTAEGLRLAGKALRTGEASDLFAKIEQRRQRAISSTSFGLEDAGIAGRTVDFLGEMVRLPGRFLAAEDEFFKAVGYRMELNARAYRQAHQEGLEGRQFAVRVQELINNPPEDLRMAAIDAARYQTFTKPLGERGQRFQGVVNSTPPLKLIMPFIRTPVNIIKFVGERTPLAPIAPSIRAEIAAGGARRDIALARISTGSLVMAVAANMADSGLVTGNGPTDSRIRSAMRRTGWQPYSILVGDKYVSYSRTDPVGATLGIAADLSEILGQLDQADAEEVTAATIMAVSQNVISKTYMQGIADVFEVFANVSPDIGASRGKQFVQRLAGTVIPAGVAQATRVLDPTLRQADSIVQKIRSRVPGYSEDLPPRLNLWGDPIVLHGGVGPDIMSPLWESPLRDSPADEEMIRLQVPISMPTRSIRGVELEQLEYNRYVELAGNGLKDPATGKGARETLEALLDGSHALSAQYQDASDGPDGGKALIIRQIIQTFREAARSQVIEEFPDLRDAIVRKAQ